ncbi:MAG: hypothetical protein HY835_04650 [Anaerolineae bacterium]|nr:hypothetical protein [Anaerolineae bacterium]
MPIPGVIGAAAVYKSNLDDYAMAADGDGNLHLIIVGQETAVQSTLDVLDVVWDGVAWQAPSVVAAYEGDVPEWPRVTVSRGNIVNVVWFVRAEETIWDSDNGKYRVWYARGVTSAARVNPEAIPTFTPTVEPTALPTQVLTPQVDAVMNANDLDTAPVSNVRPQSGDVLYSETDYVLFLAKSLIPSVIFLAGVFMVNFIRRK